MTKANYIESLENVRKHYDRRLQNGHTREEAREFCNGWLKCLYGFILNDFDIDCESADEIEIKINETYDYIDTVGGERA